MKVNKGMGENVEFIVKVMDYKHLRLLVGAYDFMYSNEDMWLRFKFKGSKKANICKITYDVAMDTFTMEFLLFDDESLNVSKVKSLPGLFAEDLVKVFEEITGLFIRFTN